ncbi:S-adenosyl-L-methionine-dependent methyltransferase [Amniculicola lignicola CBS 123094]|uniref:S-adenosyl-L-methionine-dependent methyltransferase n=1 Tax=Amniculicola lignicola CBS 123094 TaxID=1392246 RepID=A0A6A5VXH3_9PLEO|nr:S-adenosyl-L-methionine-dependent methyltransferase [Amniculicola lignicola CBS 123094]
MITFAELAADIQTQVNIIDTYLKEHNLPQPSFDVDSPTELPIDPNVQRARLKLIEAGGALENLATGSADHLRWRCMTEKFDDMVLHFLVRFNIFDAVPRNEAISLAELSQKVGVPEHRLHRIMSLAYTRYLFCEPKPGFVAHTSNSALAIGDPLASAWVLHNVEEVIPWYACKFVETTKKWGDSRDPRHTGPNLDAKPGQEKLFYDIMEEDEGEWKGVYGRGFRLKRLFDTDQFFATGGSVKGTSLLTAFDWGKLGKASVVDMSGVTGHLSMTIAQAFPDLKFIVQEKAQPWLEEKFQEVLPDDLKGTDRVRIMGHDRYAEQPIKGADIYFISTLLHKEPEERGTTFIRRIAEAMDPKKSRLIVREIVMDAGDPPSEDATSNDTATHGVSQHQAGLGPTGSITRLNIGIDLQMLTLLNVFERTRAEWIAWFKEADPRFKLKSCVQPVGNFAAVMEWVLEE